MDLINLSIVLFIIQTLCLIVLTISSIVDSNLNSLNINEGLISLGVDALSFLFSVFLVVKENQKLKKDYSNLYFNELKFSNPNFCNNKVDIVLTAKNVVLPNEYVVDFNNITVYIILVKELFYNNDLFIKFKEDEQFVRKIVLTNIKLNPADIKRTNSDTNYHIKSYDGDITNLKDILKDNAKKFKDKTMISISYNYKLVSSPNYLIGKIENKILLFFNRYISKIFLKTTNNLRSYNSIDFEVFEMNDCTNNHFIYNKPSTSRGKDEK